MAHLADIVFHGDAALDRLFDRYGDVLWLTPPKFFQVLPGISQVAVTRSPALITPLFTRCDEAIDSTRANRILQMLYGEHSLFLIDGPQHRRLRKLVLPPLHGESLRQWADIIVGSTERESRSWPAQRSVRVYPRMRDVALEVILKVAVGIPDEHLPMWKTSWRELVRIWESEEMAIRYAMRRLGVLSRWRRLHRAIHRCNELVFAEIARRRAMPEGGQADLLDLMMRAEGDPLSDEELRDQIFTIVMAGYSTTGPTVSWAVERLLRTPSAMRKATAEARSCDSTTYLEAVVHETLRVRPPIMGVARVTRQSITLGEYDFPANTLIYALVRSIHRRPELYDHPDVFSPARFLGSPPSVHAFIPFGGGPHRCLGDRFAIFQIALMLRTILRTVDLAAVNPQDEKIKCKAAVYVPGNGALVSAWPRR